jgi:hypothetical protein
MSDVLGMTATEFVLYQENQRLAAENRFLKANAGPDNIYSAAVEPQVMQIRSIQPQLNIAVQTYCRDDGYGYHVIGKTHSGLHTAYYVDRLALSRLTNWALADMLKHQLETVTRSLIEAVRGEHGMPTVFQNLDCSPASGGADGG